MLLSSGWGWKAGMHAISGVLPGARSAFWGGGLGGDPVVGRQECSVGGIRIRRPDAHEKDITRPPPTLAGGFALCAKSKEQSLLPFA